VGGGAAWSLRTSEARNGFWRSFNANGVLAFDELPADVQYLVNTQKWPGRGRPFEVLSATSAAARSPPAMEQRF